VNPVDVYGATPLDNSRQKGNDTIVALLLAERAKSGSDTSLRSDLKAIHEWAAKNKAQKLEQRKLAILKSLPEYRIAQDANAINSALQDFAKVCDMPCSIVFHKTNPCQWPGPAERNFDCLCTLKQDILHAFLAVKMQKLCHQTQHVDGKIVLGTVVSSS
jgi:hypothetical protein